MSRHEIQHGTLGFALLVFALLHCGSRADEPVVDAAASGGAGGGGGAGGVGGGNRAACLGATDCADGQMCSYIDLGAVGGTPTAGCADLLDGAAELGSPCNSNDGCESTYCYAYARTCSTACTAASDCGLGTVCVDVRKPISLCLRLCERNDDCPPNTGGPGICMLHDDSRADTRRLACDWLGVTPAQNPRVRTFGQSVSSDEVCETQLQPSTQDGKVWCTRACRSASDCASPFPLCKSVMIASPSGAGASLLVSMCSK